jgi:hypothetical protein
MQRHVLACTTIAAALTACGRLGYDPLDPGDGGATPIAPTDLDDVDAAALVAIPDSCPPPSRLAAPPVLDGAAAPGVALAPMPVIGWTGPGGAPPARHRASYALGWRDDSLYLVVAVTDSQPLPAADGHELWCGAGVELYVDHDGSYRDERRFDDPGARQLTVAAPPPAGTARRAQTFCTGCQAPGPAPARAEAVVSRATADGYVVEMLVTADDLGLPTWQLGPGSRVGFAVAVNVAVDADTGRACTPGTPDRHGRRLGQYFLKVGAGSSWPFDTYQAFCAATLTGTPGTLGGPVSIGR